MGMRMYSYWSMGVARYMLAILAVAKRAPSVLTVEFHIIFEVDRLAVRVVSSQG